MKTCQKKNALKFKWGQLLWTEITCNEKKDNKQCLSDTPAVMVNEEN